MNPFLLPEIFLPDWIRLSKNEKLIAVTLQQEQHLGIISLRSVGITNSNLLSLFVACDEMKVDVCSAFNVLSFNPLISFPFISSHSLVIRSRAACTLLLSVIKA